MAARTINFSGVKARSIGSGYPRRGLYLINVNADGCTDETSDKGTAYAQIVGAVETCYVPPEGGKGPFATEASEAGNSITLRFTYPDGNSQGGDEARERDIKALLVGIAEAARWDWTREQIDGLSGGFDFDVEWAAGLRLAVLYDPPPVGTNDYPKFQVLDVETFNGIISGKKPITWPQDRAATKRTTDAAAGTAPTGPTAAQRMMGPTASPAAGGPVPPTAGPRPAPPGATATPANGVGNPMAPPRPAGAPAPRSFGPPGAA